VRNRSEFNVANQRVYDERSGPRWLLSHVLRYKLVLAGTIAGVVGQNVLNSTLYRLVGQAFDKLLQTPPDRHALYVISLTLLALVVARSLLDLFGSFGGERIAKSVERDARDELYLSLLGKSQTFHNRQRVGDLMARAANDVRSLNDMIAPGLSLIVDSMTALVTPIIFIGFLDWRLLLMPAFFVVGFFFTVRRYVRNLEPVSNAMRANFGKMNAGLNEAVTGIDVVKSTAQEPQEQSKFVRNARAYRDAAVRQGVVQSRYLPTLVLAVTLAGALMQGFWMVTRGDLSVGQLVTFFGLMQLLRFPTFISIFTFSLVQLGLSSADRILGLIKEETELDENEGGRTGEIAGEIVFDRVSFSYENEPVLDDLSFVAKPGETVAIVGETGSGKSTLTKLVNRIYDVDSGRLLIDGTDVREWNLDALRSQISTIEQDIQLFSRPIAENIAFSLGQRAEIHEIERAAKDAQADGFIREMPDGYDTVIGERGVTLSGGQRQRIAIARALLTDPRILIIDDSTSAIDSATEDQIQRAIRRVLEGRTTLLITHRLSQIRWADRILVLRRGRLVDQGTHEELIERCDLYRRIFAHYAPLPAPTPDSDRESEPVIA
jgi:ATP-binding cassette subfamily B protein